MDVSRALEQLNEIHTHLGRSEIYRGYRSRTLVLMASVGIFAGAWLQMAGKQLNPLEKVCFWVLVAALNLSLATWEVLGDYFSQKTSHQKKLTQRAVGQFLPALYAGAGLTIYFAYQDKNLHHLPGLWSVCFGLGMLASRPYLPRGVGLVGAFCLSTGLGLLWLGPDALEQAVFMSATFGATLLAMAYVMYHNLERKDQ